MSAYELPEPAGAILYNDGEESAFTADQMQAAFEAGRLQGEASGQALEREADTARIDWLESWCRLHAHGSYSKDDLYNLIGWYCFDDTDYATLRDALDAARGVT